VQKAIDRAADGDTVLIKKGKYDLRSYSGTIAKKISLIGEDRQSTILTNGRVINFEKSLTVKNFTFSGGPALKLAPPEGQKLDGVAIENCTFEKFWAAVYAAYYKGAIANVTVTNCEFRDMEAGKIFGVVMYRGGPISNVKITNNTFKNLKSTRKGCMALFVAGKETTEDVLVSGNTMDTISGPTHIVKGAGPEVHGIIVFGTNVRIEKNTIKNLNAGRDHEAIYVKARNCVIADNVVENCGSEFGGADICSKGADFSDGILITGNRITGDQPGTGIHAAGGTVIKDNHIKKTKGSLGISLYPLGKPATIANNYVETRHCVAIYVNGGDGAGYRHDWPDPGKIVVSGNVAVVLQRDQTGRNRKPIVVTNTRKDRTQIAENEQRIEPSDEEAGPQKK